MAESRWFLRARTRYCEYGLGRQLTADPKHTVSRLSGHTHLAGQDREEGTVVVLDPVLRGRPLLPRHFPHPTALQMLSYRDQSDGMCGPAVVDGMPRKEMSHKGNMRRQKQTFFLYINTKR